MDCCLTCRVSIGCPILMCTHPAPSHRLLRLLTCIPILIPYTQARLVLTCTHTAPTHRLSVLTCIPILTPSHRFDVLAPTIGGVHSVADLLRVCLAVVARAQPALARARGAGVVALFLPRNTDLLQLQALVPNGCTWQLERNFVNSKLKGVTLYAFSSAL